MKTIARIMATAMIALAPIAPLTAPSANAQPHEDSAVILVTPVWQIDYYRNVFVSKDSCDARGRQMTTYQQVPNMVGWRCYRHTGDARWNMDVAFDSDK